MVFKWRNADSADCEDFVKGVFLVNLVVDGVAAERRRHLPIHSNNKREEPLLVYVKIKNLHALVDEFSSFPEKVEPNCPALPQLP